MTGPDPKGAGGPERGDALHRIMAHVTAETHRHAGHADIVRELIDGSVGRQPGRDTMTPGDRSWWEAYRNRLEQAARDAGRGACSHPRLR